LTIDKCTNGGATTMDGKKPSTNGGITIVVILSFHYKTNPHLWPSIIHDLTKKNHIQNKNKNWSKIHSIHTK
jgi:hypothetical protein